MTRKSDWPKGIEIQKIGLALPKRLWQTGRMQALKEGRTFQEVIAEALEDYLRKKKGGDRR